ncbi:unnamed protein product [Ophioblennius macclurei]
MTDSVVVEGYARLRDGKKWKTRWLVLRKPSPVADCLVLLVFKDKSEKVQGNKERTSVTLEEICGLEAGQWYEGVAYTLAIVCLNQTALLGFDGREALQAWDARLRYSLGEVHRFSVGILPGTKLESGPATLHLCNNLLALARDVPPAIVGHWSLPDLRRYGPVPHGFVFEGGTRCGYWAGVFLLASAESEQISFLFDCIVRGMSPTRGPFGLRPILPDPSASQTVSEEKLNHEAQELEKRLSMLSHGSSSASSTYGPCPGGDDRSISGSSDTSDTSQSDGSVGSRLAIWSEPANSNPPEGVGHVGSKVALHIVEKISVTPGPGNRPAAAVVGKPPRQLQEIGRQSSSDSGIATGSHSSYSGSFSSYTGSLDMAPGEDFGSVFNLPPQDLSPCTCPAAHGHDYQAPTSLRYLYDTPRSLLQDDAAATKHATESAKEDKSGAATSEGHSDAPERQSSGKSLRNPSEESKKAKAAPSSDSLHVCSSVSKTIVTVCSLCGGFKGTPQTPSGSSAIPAIPDVSVGKSHGRPNGVENVSPRGAFLEKPGVFPRSEESVLPKKGREKLGSLIADLLGFPNTESKKDVVNPYESMSPAFGNDLDAVPAQLPEKRAVIYENCLKCQGSRCQPPPRPIPAKTFMNRNFYALQTFPTHLKKSQEREKDEEEVLHQVPGDGSQRDGEMSGRALTGEDKRLNGREERRRVDPAYEIMENRVSERNSEADDKKYELMGSYGQQRLLQETEGAVFVFPPEVPPLDRPRSEGVTYVNIPISPTSKKQLNYMELELQEPAHGATRGTAAHLPGQRKSSTKYAQIDITATETAHKVGAQHALGRQEGLHALELRRKGTPH